MDKYTRFSARASLAVMGKYVHQMKIWQTVEKHVHIKQKVIRHKPLDKLMDAFINILAGGAGLTEVNTRVRPDRVLQQAFGREGCADQSTVSDTLNACTDRTVGQMRQAMQEIYRIHSQGYRHDYNQGWQVLDVDMTGMPAGRQGEGVTKGYFSGQKNRRGRQLGRVIATLYDEIVVECLYDGKRQLDRSLQALVTDAEQVLKLTKRRRQRTIVRVDAGGGRDEDINWLLRRDYHILGKVKNWRRAAKLAQSVTVWYPDSKVPKREVGWVESPHEYDRPTRQLAIRHRKKDGTWSYHVLVFTLTDSMIFWLARRPFRKNHTPEEVLFASLQAYDLRSGGVETTIKGSKQGLGLIKRNKRLFAAQEMLVLLAQLAYNLISWTRNLLAVQSPSLRRFGMLRMVRDVFHIPGKAILDSQDRILRITLTNSHVLAPPLVRALAPILDQGNVLLNLGQI